jgi:ribosomal protein S18 acetylase RimI-like enzyme
MILTKQHASIIIRTAQVADAQAIAGIRVVAWQAAYRGLMPDAYLERADLEATETEQLRNRLAAIGDRAHISVAETNERMVGYCAYECDANDERACLEGAIYDLYVHPQLWYHGVGQRLLAYATGYFKLQGCSQATLFVYEENIRARRFYERAEWTRDGYRDLYKHFDFSRPVLRYRTTL